MLNNPYYERIRLMIGDYAYKYTLGGGVIFSAILAIIGLLYLPGYWKLISIGWFASMCWDGYEWWWRYGRKG